MEHYFEVVLIGKIFLFQLNNLLMKICLEVKEHNDRIFTIVKTK